MAVKVLVCERRQPLLTKLPSADVTVGLPHASVAFALLSAADITADEGLHPSGTVVKSLVNTGGLVSSVHVTVLDAVAVLPQPSVAVNVLVCDLKHPPLTDPSL